MAPKPPDVKPGGKPGGIMKKKIGPIPVPVAILIVAAVAYLGYRHYKNSSASGTSGVSSTGSSAVDPNAVDPQTGLTYGAEEQAALGAQAGQPSTNGTGADGVGGGGMSLGDLEGLLTALQGFGGTSYYYGSGSGFSDQTPTNPAGPGSLSPGFAAATTAVPSDLAASAAQGGGSAGPTVQLGNAPANVNTALGQIQSEEGYGTVIPQQDLSSVLATQAKAQAYLGNIATTQLGVPVGGSAVPAAKPVDVNQALNNIPSGAGAVKAGTAKVNYQAKAKAI